MAGCFSSATSFIVLPVLCPACITLRAHLQWHLQSATPPRLQRIRAQMRSPSPSLSFSPLSPGPCSELSDPLSLPGREEGEDKFIPVPEQKALCAQTQQGMRIRGAPGIRKASESSKSFGTREPRGMVSWTQTWAGCLGNCSAEDPHGIQRSHLGISLGLSFPLHSKRCV